MSDPVTIDQLLAAYANCSQGSVRYRPRTWVTALDGLAPAAVLAVLGDETIGQPSAGHPGDRLLARRDVQQVVDHMDLDDEHGLLRAFLLVQAWGTGPGSGRMIAHTKTALTAHDRLMRSLQDSARTLRSATDPSTLAEAYNAWDAPGVSRSFFTKWFAYAGRAQARAWQPLILDNRVLATLNDTLGFTTLGLAGGARNWGARYQAYVTTAHHWGHEFPGGPVPAERVEWVLFAHNGAPDAQPQCA